MTRKGKVFWFSLMAIIWPWLGYGVYAGWTSEVELWVSIVGSIMLPMTALMLSLIFREMIKMLDEAFKEGVDN